MKRGVDLLTIGYNDIFVSQAVQTPKDILRTEIGLTFKIGNLGIGMYAGICPAGSRQGYLSAGYGENRLFDLFLDGPVIFLTLPAMIAGSIVLDYYFEIFYHYMQKT